MKRQMKMTTAKKPQKKAFGGALKKIIPKISQAVKNATETSKTSVKNTDTTPPTFEQPQPPGKVTRPRIFGKALKGFGRALSKLTSPGMKKGGSVMSDKMGRAVKKKTADVRGRAMKGK